MKRIPVRLLLAVAASFAFAGVAQAQSPCKDCGVVGHQIGSGRGNTVATIAGAGLGAVAGNQVEKNTKSSTTWSVSIRMDNGTLRTFNYSSQPAVVAGDRVKLVDGGKRLALVAK